jgi:hypothetical protein
VEFLKGLEVLEKIILRGRRRGGSGCGGSYGKDVLAFGASDPHTFRRHFGLVQIILGVTMFALNDHMLTCRLLNHIGIIMIEAIQKIKDFVWVVIFHCQRDGRKKIPGYRGNSREGVNGRERVYTRLLPV